MRIKYKKNFKLGKNVKIKISTNGNITIITKYKDNNISLNKNRLIVYGKNGVIKKQKQLWIFKKKKLNLKSFLKSIKGKYNKLKNKIAISNQIIELDLELKKGIKKYKISRLCFWGFLIFTFILRENLTICIFSVILSIYFSILAFNNLTYKKAYLTINNISKDLSFMNLYNEEKVNNLLNQFKNHYGSCSEEYIQLKNAIKNFNDMGINLANNLSNLEIEDISYYLKNINLRKEEIKNNKYNKNNSEIKNKFNTNNKKINYISSVDNKLNNKFAILCRKEIQQNVDIKSINRVIEFFEEDDNNINEKGKDKAVVSRNDNNLTVYFYKKSSVF